MLVPGLEPGPGPRPGPGLGLGLGLVRGLGLGLVRELKHWVAEHLPLLLFLDDFCPRCL